MKIAALRAKSKILVIGSPGAGKTVFTKKLALLSDKPAIHIDDYYWLPGWVKLDSEKWLSLLHDLCTKDTWIMDGNHAKTLSLRLAYADAVVFLDFSAWKCLWSYAVRSLRRYSGVNDNLPKPIADNANFSYNFKINWHMIRLILGFKLLTKPKMIKQIELSKVHCLKVKSRSELENFLSSE